MIFVTVGTDVHRYERLVVEIDRIAGDLNDDVTTQLGQTDYQPSYTEWFQFTSSDEIDRLYEEAAAIVPRAGAGTVNEIISRGKPAIIVPRREEYNDHGNGHQRKLANGINDWDGTFIVDDASQIKIGYAVPRWPNHRNEREMISSYPSSRSA